MEGADGAGDAPRGRSSSSSSQVRLFACHLQRAWFGPAVSTRHVRWCSRSCQASAGAGSGVTNGRPGFGYPAREKVRATTFHGQRRPACVWFNVCIPAQHVCDVMSTAVSPSSSTTATTTAWTGRTCTGSRRPCHGRGRLFGTLAAADDECGGVCACAASAACREGEPVPEVCQGEHYLQP